MAAKRPADTQSTESPKKEKKDNVNKDLCDMLKELADFEKNVARNIHKSNVYLKAARALEHHEERITSGKEAMKLDGVGVKIGAKIDEYLKTGALKRLEVIHQDPKFTAIQLLTSVNGIGPAHARELVEKGITTIDQLRGIKDTLNHAQQIGLKYYEELSQRIPRCEMDMLRDEVLRLVHKTIPDAHVEIAGSYRRGKPNSGDVDILMTVDKFRSDTKKDPGAAKHISGLLHKVVNDMTASGFITDTLSCGETKFMGVCVLPAGKVEGTPLHRRIDIRLWPSDQFYPALLYFTGSDEFNKEMRRKAIELGFRLNEYGIQPMGETGVLGDALPVASERDIFNYLDMEYVDPESR